MSKKTSHYMRKRMSQGRVQGTEVMFKPNAWLERLTYNRPYTDEPLLGAQPTTLISEAAITRASTSLFKMKNGLVDDNNTDVHDDIAHFIGVSQIRIRDIGGPVAGEIIDELNKAARAILRARERHERTGKWGLDGPAIGELDYALAIYTEVVRSSSPQQMEDAQGKRLDAAKKEFGVAA
jgi:hypothetical protein